jgi:hypothetical protein
MSVRGFARGIGWAAAIIAVGVAAHATIGRPYLLGWGATSEEVSRALPGDDLVTGPRLQMTNAITINAAPSQVWPWIAQWGQGRGGLYSYDWLENLVGCDVHSVNQVLPEHQDPKVGDEIRMVRKDYVMDIAYQVARIDPGRYWVLISKGERASNYEKGLSYFSYAWVLEPLSGGRTRLIVRARSDYRPDVMGFLFNGPGLEPIQFLMQRKTMLGIKERAERLAVQAAAAGM